VGERTCWRGARRGAARAGRQPLRRGLTVDCVRWRSPVLAGLSWWHACSAYGLCTCCVYALVALLRARAKMVTEPFLAFFKKMVLQLLQSAHDTGLAGRAARMPREAAVLRSGGGGARGKRLVAAAVHLPRPARNLASLPDVGPCCGGDTHCALGSAPLARARADLPLPARRRRRGSVGPRGERLACDGRGGRRARVRVAARRRGGGGARASGTRTQRPGLHKQCTRLPVQSHLQFRSPARV
jgi:hypothetical protein